MQVDQQSANRGAKRGVEVRERFVEQEHARASSDRPSQGHALALAARERLGPARQGLA